LDAALAQALAAVEVVTHQASPRLRADEPPASTGDAASVLAELAELLQASDSAAADCFTEHQHTLRGALSASAWHGLNEAMNGFDFDAALHAIGHPAAAAATSS
ncbi:MAG: hypothetical protein Q8N44_08260, partial [Rubrivivax sp.]|nr:hypothetical protein [Rubrivivax sp.]